MQFYLFNICSKLHHRKWRKVCSFAWYSITLSNFLNFTRLAAVFWCCSSSNLYPETLS